MARGRLLVAATACLLGARGAGPSASASSSAPNTTAQAPAASSSTGTPHISFLELRCTDRPVDLEPRFRADHYVYSATLDYSMSSFAVDAIPARGMEILDLDGVQTTKLMSPGATHRVDIRVKEPVSQNEMQYTVTVTRLDGTDIAIKNLAIKDATITPMFDPAVTTYTVRLPASTDDIWMEIVPRDVGQRVQVFLLPEKVGSGPAVVMPATTTTTTTTPLPGSIPDVLMPHSPVAQGAPSGGRRLIGSIPRVPSGERQIEVVTERFPIDVGASVVVQVRVGPANGDQSNTRVYELHTSRAACPSHRPFYAPDLQQCSETCDEGYFRNNGLARCEACPDLCLKCTAWDRCEICQQSEWRTLTFIRHSDGYCRQLPIPWQWIGIAAGSLVILLSVCCCICRSPSEQGNKAVWRRGRSMKVADSDTEYDMYDAE